MKILKRILKAVLIFVAVSVVGFAGLILFAIASDYKPGEKELIALTENPSVLGDSLLVTLLTWNIGYAGLDREMDFFYDGGTKVITPENKCLENISSIEHFWLKTTQSTLSSCRKLTEEVKEATELMNI